MDLRKRIDPGVAAVLPGLPVLDLTDIPVARQALLDRDRDEALRRAFAA